MTNITYKQLQEMTTQDVLRDARREIGQYWVQGELGSPGKAVCALGSVSSVLELMHTNGGMAYPNEFPASTKKEKRMKSLAMAACETLYKALPVSAQRLEIKDETHTDRVLNAIVNYNDKKDRHKRTITKWFDRAITVSGK